MFLYNWGLTLYLIKMKNIFIGLWALLFTCVTTGQENKATNYKYIIVPQKLEFLKEIDQYQTSSLTKFLLEKNGFTVILDSEEYPLELKQELCKALNVAIINESSIFKTSVRLELKDCFNQLVYASDEGSSRLKDYKRSYQEAIRNMHGTMGSIIYSPKMNSGRTTMKKKEELRLDRKEIAVHMIQKAGDIGSSELEDSIDSLSAKSIQNGYQLTDISSGAVFTILNTGREDCFIVKESNGILYKKDAVWFSEYYEGNKRITKRFVISFAQKE